MAGSRSPSIRSVTAEHVLIDPFLTGNPKAAVKADEVAADLILISHGHGDHVGDCAGDRETHRGNSSLRITRSANGFSSLHRD